MKAYVKRNKNDAADAEAICEAVRRPTMRFVRIKSAEQQGQLMQHRTRDVLIRQRTQIINALRAHLGELGLVAAQGNAGVNELRAIVTDGQDTRLPIDARASVIVLAAQLEALESVIGAIEKRIKMQHRSSEASQRVEAIPGIGVIGATAIVATVADPAGRGRRPRAVKGSRPAECFQGTFHRVDHRDDGTEERGAARMIDPARGMRLSPPRSPSAGHPSR